MQTFKSIIRFSLEKPSFWDRHLLNRATTDHISFDLRWNLLVFNIQILHCLVLSVFSTCSNFLYLFVIIRVILLKLSNFKQSLVIDTLHGCEYVFSWHVLINTITM